MKKPKLLFIMLGLLIICNSGCSKLGFDDMNIPESGNMKLGKKLENPYTVQNMQQAYANLKSSKPAMPDYSINTTHYYIRLRPATMEEIDLLEDDSTKLWSTVPLDYELEKNGYFYHDPSLPYEEKTWLYGVVEKNADIPNIPYQVLDELFLPPTPDALVKNYDDKMISFFDELEHEALKITNNLEGDEELKSSKGSRWNPGGRVTMWDDAAQDFVGIAHVKVRVRRWFRTTTAITDADGYYLCVESFKRPANYKIVWKRYDFSVSTNKNRANSPNYYESDGQASDRLFRLLYLGCKRTQYLGPKLKGEWNPKIDKGTPHHFHANLFRAGAHYYYGNIDGIRRPPMNDDIGTQMKIIAHYDNKYTWTDEDAETLARHSPNDRNWVDPTWITINNTGLKNPEFAGLTIRMLAHASLWYMDKEAYEENSNDIKWCWTIGVEQCLMKKLYPSYKIKYRRGYQAGIVEDLMDGIKTTYCDYNNSEFEPAQYNDSVAYYTLAQIENALQGANSPDEWKNNLKTMYENETEIHLDNTFSFWFDTE